METVLTGFAMGRGRRRRVVVAAMMLLCLVGGGAFAAPGVNDKPTAVDAVVGIGSSTADLPDGGPPALHRPEPALPPARGWPFPESFSRTLGSGRLVGGAFLWTDFLYDDYGAKGGVRQQSAVVSGAYGAPSGTYSYPDDTRAGRNGADIFRVGVALDQSATHWRVDWNTLIDPELPIALWTFDTDNNPSTGGTAWPAATGVSAPGFERALLVSARGAWLHDASGGRLALGKSAITVDRAARTFVARVPRSVLPVGGSWRVRMGSGVSNAAGDGFDAVAAAQGANSGQPAVYNVTFRDRTQEKPSPSEWMEDAQATALGQNDATPFSALVRWTDLRDKRTTAEPLPTGFSNRWYVSSLEIAQGVEAAPDLHPQFLGRVQPYAVYVPHSYTPSRPMRLTFVLHQLSDTHNQYGRWDPVYLERACEHRYSLCVTTLGRGGGVWYYDSAELDFWEVWNRVTAAYSLDPRRTAINGVSMGGWASNKLGLTQPDLFASAVPYAGPIDCSDITLIDGVVIPFAPDDVPQCFIDGYLPPLVKNARWTHYTLEHGFLDELVPIGGAIAWADHLQAAGNRYRAEFWFGKDHVVQPATDFLTVGAPSMARALDGSAPPRNPGHVTYSWYPSWEHPEWGLVRSAYWLTSLTARDRRPGHLATVDALSAARPEAAITPVATQTVAHPDGEVDAAVIREQTWKRGATRSRAPRLTLQLTNVRSVSVDCRRAGFRADERGVLVTTADGAGSVRIGGRALSVPRGTSRRPFGCPFGATSFGNPDGSRAPGALATTGGNRIPLVAMCLLVSAVLICFRTRPRRS